MTKPSPTDMRAESIRAALAAIAEKHGGYLNPAHVVEAAADPAHVLHDEFEWDDADAAGSYRLAQAGALIRRVKFTIVKPDPTTKEVQLVTTRQYQSRPSQRNAEGGYESVPSILADESKREELLQQVLRELKAYRKRYAELAALTEVWAAIDEAIDVLGTSAPARQGMAGQAGHGVASRGV
jgi:hypothetical protein